MDGILNIDKPAGLSSHDVVNRVRRLMSLKQVGHAGTLDPLATGVLLVCTGQATRLVEYVTAFSKTYQALIRLGQATTTYDGEGQLIATQPVAVSRPELEGAVQSFQGAIEQVPPMYSAIKQGGKPLYKLARQGIEVERKPRPVTIYALEIVSWQSPLVELEIVCSAGTYIRSLAHDLGQLLGCGGYLANLRRTAVGPFMVSEGVPLETLTATNLSHYLQSPGLAVAHLPQLSLSQELIGRLTQGQTIPRHTSEPEGSEATLLDPAGTLVGLLVARPGLWQPRKIFH